MRPDQLHLLRTPSAPTLHPDGGSAVVAVTRPDLDTDEYVGQLWSVPVSGDGTPALLTRGHRDTAPRFSPDGRLLAFLRAEPGGQPQLHVMRAEGGEPVRLTAAPLGAGAPRWSPDGTRLAYVARDPEPGRYGTDENVGPDAEPPRLFTDQRYLLDGVGYIQDRRAQVFVVDVPDLGEEPVPAPKGEHGSADLPGRRPPVRITEEDTEHQSVCWSPDGSRLAFVSARHEDRVGDLRADAWTCKPDGSDVVRVTDGSLTIEQVAFSTDGTRLWLLGSDPGPDGLDFVARHTGLWSVPVDGSAAPVRCTDAESLDLGEWDTHLTPVPGGVLVQVRNRGAVDLLLVPDDGEPRTLLGGPRWVLGHDAVLTEQGLTVVATVASDQSCGEIVAVLPGPERVLTDFSGPLRETAGIRPMRELTVPADDGVPVHGWVVLPDGPGPHPVLLNVHGGPFMQHGWNLNDEAQLLAAHGYAVLLANPRGSAGYGEEFGRVIQGAMGQRDAADLLDFLEGALADPELHLDGSRVGVLGISYGGYMTAWLTTHPRSVDRFAAAVVESGFLDPVSFAGTADIGWFFGRAYTGTDREQVAAQSPMAAVHRVRTPTLVIHSEQDYRCPLEQGQRWFAELLRNGVDAEFLVFPGESHLLTLNGRPRHRRQRFDHLLRWWGSRLPVDGGRPAGTTEE